MAGIGDVFTEMKNEAGQWVMKILLVLLLLFVLWVFTMCSGKGG